MASAVLCLQDAQISRDSVPSTSAETDKDRMYAPPKVAPAAWEQYLRQYLDPKVYAILCVNKVPYLIMKQLADDDYGDVATLCMRWGSVDKLMHDGVRSLSIGEWEFKHRERVLATMAAALDDLHFYKTERRALANKSKDRQVVEDSDRRSMEKAYMDATGERPPPG